MTESTLEKEVPVDMFHIALELFQKLSSGVGGPQALFFLCGESVLLTMCPRGGGVGVTCPGDQGVFDP